MKLSIIIPIYNVEPYLPQTIESVLAQSFRDFELILVNNGSSDGSGAICDRFEAKDNRVRVIHQKNTGVSDARNTGVSAARGDYIGFTDSDDLIERDMYQVLMAWAEQYDADVVQCQHDRAGQLNNAARSKEPLVMDGAGFVRRMFTKSGGMYTNQVSLCTKVFKRELFEGITFPVGQVYEDEQETYKLCLKSKILVETPDILYHYVKRDNSIITGISAKKMLDKQAALLDRLFYLPERLPDIRDECARSFLGFSRSILVDLAKAGETEAMKKGLKVLLKHKKQYKSVMTNNDRLYFPLLRICPNWVLKNDFMPIQKLLGRAK